MYDDDESRPPLGSGEYYNEDEASATGSNADAYGYDAATPFEASPGPDYDVPSGHEAAPDAAPEVVSAPQRADAPHFSAYPTIAMPTRGFPVWPYLLLGVLFVVALGLVYLVASRQPPQQVTVGLPAGTPSTIVLVTQPPLQPAFATATAAAIGILGTITPAPSATPLLSPTPTLPSPTAGPQSPTLPPATPTPSLAPAATDTPLVILISPIIPTPLPDSPTPAPLPPSATPVPTAMPPSPTDTPPLPSSTPTPVPVEPSPTSTLTPTVAPQTLPPTQLPTVAPTPGI